MDMNSLIIQVAMLDCFITQQSAEKTTAGRKQYIKYLIR